MMEKNKIETGFGSDAKKEPRRVVFVTKKTSAKVVGDSGPQLMTYPHLLIREAIAFQVLVIAMVLIALLWNAPLEQLANPLITPNPAKAPWYFLGLQELLHFFPPFVAGILIPTLVVIALVVIPYFNVNIEGEAIWARRPSQNLRTVLIAVTLLLAFLAVFRAWTIFAPTALVAALLLFSYTVKQGQEGWRNALAAKPLSWWVMTWFIAVAICLTAVGTFFRGPGWSWVWPWRTHVG
jgi:quinol---cytochrome c reductase cytochrome c subunit, bacillus type